MPTLLSTTYFGPIQWYQKLCCADQVLIEQCESFQKQTYRNRCIIATANGPQALTVPIEHSPLTIDHFATQQQASAVKVQSSKFLRPFGSKRPEVERKVQSIKDLRISDHGNWRHLHWNALVSAYGESPFFDYYQDDLRPFFEKRWDFLFDFNEEIRMKMCELLDIQPHVSFTESFQPSPDTKDFREAINPKHPAPDPDFTPRPYYQVYRQRHGFLPNLSILDLLFNMGPEAIFWLMPTSSAGDGA